MIDEDRLLKKPVGTIELTEKNISPLSLVTLILALGLFFFCFYFYLSNKDPLLLVIIMLCLQFFFKYLDNVPSKIFRLYHNTDTKDKE